MSSRLVRPLVTVHEDRIFQVSTPIDNIDDSISKLADDMIDTMYHNEGIGLAGSQIGILKRIFVMDIPGKTDGPIVCINPIIVKIARGKVISSEGCLSIPKFYHKVPRSRELVLEYTDLKGEKKVLEATDILAICIQHECDHLDGKLFLHNAPVSSWSRINRLLKKAFLPGFLG